MDKLEIKEFENWILSKYIAHRGLNNENAPENSLKAFQNAIDNNYIIELDVHEIKDGTLVVFHDKKLSRVTGKDGYLKNLAKDDLKNYHLCGSEETIPTLDEVLQLVNGQTEIIIEVKNSGKVGSLESKLLKTLNEYNGKFAIMSFNPFVLHWFLKFAPHIPRGQLSTDFKNEKMSYLKKYFLKRLAFTKKTKTNFIAYEGRCLPNRFVKKYDNLPLLAWTIRSQEEYYKVIEHCDNIIFENFIPKV